MSDERSEFFDPLGEADAMIEAGKARDAAALLTKKIEEGRGGALTRIALVRALLASGQSARALAVAREAAQISPGIAIAATALGEALLNEGHLPAAIAEFQRALRLDPDSAPARFGLGRAWLMAGESAKAQDAFRATDPTTKGLADAMAEADAMARETRSPAGYVKTLFDQFSTQYDARMLGQLAYQAPAILRELASLTLPDRRSLNVLDLGCGTGLAGLAFRDLASSLTGIDLSPRMIESSRERRIYDRLEVGDIETVALEPDTYDLVIAADTLVYLGDLSKTFARISASLTSNGAFLFTVERNGGEGFALGPKRRWQHGEAYLRGLADETGFSVLGLLDCVPRHEAGEPVNGIAVALLKV